MATITLPAETAAETLREATETVLGKAGLFDPEPYTLPVPRADGMAADAISIAFSGSVELDPHDEDDLALIEALRLDSDVTLKVEVAVAGKAMKIKRSEDETVATHVIACRVHTLYRDAAEEL
jgi:hypothetical protein